MEEVELITTISQNTDVTAEQAKKIVDAFVATIKEGLLRGEKVTISGFGTFSLSKRKASHNIPEKLMPKFKPGADFRSKS